MASVIPKALLHEVLSRMDSRSLQSQTFFELETRPWPPGAVEALQNCGLLSPFPEEYGDAVLRAASRHFTPRFADGRGYCIVRDGERLGELEAFLCTMGRPRWRADLSSLSRSLRNAMNLAGPMRPLSPGLLWSLGVTSSGAEFFIAHTPSGPIEEEAITKLALVRNDQPLILTCLPSPQCLQHDSVSFIALEWALEVDREGLSFPDDFAELLAVVGALQRKDDTPPVAASLEECHVCKTPSPDGPDLEQFKDYGLVRCKHGEFRFSTSQAMAVKALHNAHLSGKPEYHQQWVLAKAESESDQLRDLFKRHDAWGTLIVPGEAKGCYRLDL